MSDTLPHRAPDTSPSYLHHRMDDAPLSTPEHGSCVPGYGPGYSGNAVFRDWTTLCIMYHYHWHYHHDVCASTGHVHCYRSTWWVKLGSVRAFHETSIGFART